MAQQINLYQKEILQKEQLLDFKQSLRILYILLGVLLLATVVEIVRHFSMQNEVKNLEQVKATYNKELKKTQKGVVIKMSREQMLKQIQILEEQKVLHQNMVEELKKIKISGMGGFSKFLTALAEQTTTGVWFTHFVFRNPGNYIALEGKVQKPELLPNLIDNLSKEPVFEGQTFQVFKLSVDEKTKEINFILQTVAEKK